MQLLRLEPDGDRLDFRASRASQLPMRKCGVANTRFTRPFAQTVKSPAASRIWRNSARD
jgi:hypothetical protein